MTPPRTIRRAAPAKINVFLRVLGSRDDGYHDVQSLVVPLTLADRVEVTDDDRLAVEVTGERELTDEVPVGGLNLALVAALAFADAVPHRGGASIRIEKSIPVAAGLGGGSADAAAALLALNELWGAGLDVDALADVAERVGSDVPAMLLEGPVVISGRGEILTPVTLGPMWWVLVTFGFGVRSPDAYRWWDDDGASSGPDPAPLLETASAGNVAALGELLFNDLEAPVVARHPEIGAAKRRLLELGALGAVMSGSGSSVVALCRDREHARAVAARTDRAIVISGPPAGADDAPS